MTETKQQLLRQYHDAVDSYMASTRGKRSNGGSRTKEKDVALIKESFERQGLIIRYGRWNIQEKKLLHENFERFIRQHKDAIGNPVDFVSPSEDKERAREVKELKRELDFLLCLSQGLFREGKAVNFSIYNTLDPLTVSRGQKYSVKDRHILKSLVDKHGRNWKAIAKEMGRWRLSLLSAHTNFFLHDGCTRKPPTRKQQKKLIKEMQNIYPDKDLTCDIIKNVPWTSIANKIGFRHGKYLFSFWETKVKYRDEEGKIRLKNPGKTPPKLIRKFIRHLAKQKPTHLDALNWDHYMKMFAGYVPGIFMLKRIIHKMLRRYNIDQFEIGLAKAVKQLNVYVKRTKRLGFQSIWDEIKADSIKPIRWQRFHWALSPELAHYIHQAPMMYLGYAEDHSDVTVVKEEPLDMDDVW